MGYRDDLARLADRCGKPEAMSHLAYFVSKCKIGSKTPHLLVRRDAGGELEAAVFLNEYLLWGVPTGVFVPAEMAEQQNILAPQEQRSQFAVEAAAYLLRRRALVVQVSVKDGNFDVVARRGLGRFQSANQVRTVVQNLPLRPTLDETLALLGAHTRRNLRHFRRRAEIELGATFETKVSLTEAEFLNLNRHTLYPVPTKAALCRYRWSREASESFLVGLRGADGAWLSLVGGRRLDGATTIDWQMNANSLPAFSLGTAMRSFLMEHEISRETRLLTFDGGTPHSMSRAFIPETVSDLLMTRSFLPPKLLRKIIPQHLPAGHPLAKMLLSETLAWEH